jgi:hypothetical protein
VYLSVAWLGVLLFAPPSLAADAPNCPSNGITLADGQTLVIQGDCRVQGDITVQGTGALVVTESRFILTGNLTVRGAALAFIDRSEFTVDNRFSQEFSVDTSGMATLWLNKTIFHSSTKTDSNYFMLMLTRENARLWIIESSLSVTNSWVLGGVSNSAQVVLSSASNLPTEIIPSNQATIRIENQSQTSLWMPFDFGARAMVFLPDQTTGPYSFEFGRRTPGVVNVPWDITIANSIVRLGVSSMPWSDVTIVGRGKGFAPAGSGEIAVGYWLTGSIFPETISGLRPGYQAYTRLAHQGRNLTLYNTEVDPIGWNIWIGVSPATVTIRDSILNEVGAWGGTVEIQQSVLQWAVLGSTGPGSRVVVRDSDLYSQSLYAALGGRIEVRDSTIHGSPLQALDGSAVQVTNSLLVPNGPTNPCTLREGLTSSGVPICDPFIPPDAMPAATRVGTGTVTIDGTPPAARTDMQVVGWADPEPVAAGGLFTYHAQTGNAGPDPATNVRVRFTTPPQATVDSVSPGCSVSGSYVTCNVGNLPLFGGSNWLTVTYRATIALSPLVGEVTVFSDQFDPEPANHFLRYTNTIR